MFVSKGFMFCYGSVTELCLLTILFILCVKLTPYLVLDSHWLSIYCIVFDSLQDSCRKP